MLRADPDELLHCRAIPARCLSINGTHDNHQRPDGVTRHPRILASHRPTSQTTQALDVQITSALQNVVQDALSSMQTQWQIIHPQREIKQNSNNNSTDETNPNARELLHRFCKESQQLNGSFSSSFLHPARNGMRLSQLASSSRARAQLALSLSEFCHGDEEDVISDDAHATCHSTATAQPMTESVSRRVSLRDAWQLARLVVPDMPLELVVFVARVVSHGPRALTFKERRRGWRSSSDDCANSNDTNRARKKQNGTEEFETEEEEEEEDNENALLDDRKFVLRDLLTALAVFVSYAEFWRWCKQHFTTAQPDNTKTSTGSDNTPNETTETGKQETKTSVEHMQRISQQQRLLLLNRVPLSCLADQDQPKLGSTPVSAFLEPLVGASLDAIADRHACALLIHQVRSIHGKDASADDTVPPAGVLSLALQSSSEVSCGANECSDMDLNQRTDEEVTLGHFLNVCLKHNVFGERLMRRTLVLHGHSY